MNAIELNHVAKRYGDFALEDVNLTLPQGCVLGLIGENGAGKSTILKTISHHLACMGGVVRIGAPMTPRPLASPCRKTTGRK